jgi:hypothetical protein
MSAHEIAEARLELVRAGIGLVSLAVAAAAVWWLRPRVRAWDERRRALVEQRQARAWWHARRAQQEADAAVAEFGPALHDYARDGGCGC